MNKYKLLATVGLILGLLSLSSIIAYAAGASFWWVETTRADMERGMMLAMLHLSTLLGGAVSFAYLFTEWEPE